MTNSIDPDQSAQGSSLVCIFEVLLVLYLLILRCLGRQQFKHYTKYYEKEIFAMVSER